MLTNVLIMSNKLSFDVIIMISDLSIYWQSPKHKNRYLFQHIFMICDMWELSTVVIIYVSRYLDKFLQ